jgi:tRNA nucleotidyltransferase (CCA-adding enzyme)
MSKEEQHSQKPAKILRPKAAGTVTSSAQVRVRLIPDIQELKKSVSVDNLKEQGFTTNLPRTIEIVPSTDNSGANSLDVIVVFPKSMREEEVASAQTSRMLSWIQDTILSRSDESGGRWPYVFVKVDGKDVCPA